MRGRDPGGNIEQDRGGSNNPDLQFESGGLLPAGGLRFKAEWDLEPGIRC